MIQQELNLLNILLNIELLEVANIVFYILETTVIFVVDF